jgi:CelD/BcsL family acetyltransferase involved in cellulose biosynthesis
MKISAQLTSQAPFAAGAIVRAEQTLIHGRSALASSDRALRGWSTSVCTTYPELAALAREWNELLKKAHHTSAFLMHEWIVTWWELIGAAQPTRELFIVLARDGEGRLAGLLPLYRESIGRGPLRRRVLRLLGSAPEAPEHLDAIALRENAQDVVGVLVSALAVQRHEFDAIELLDLADGSLLRSTLKEWSREQSYGLIEWNWQTCPFITVKGTYDKYLMSLSQRHRYKVRLFGRRLAAAHAVELEVAGDPVHVGPALEAMFELHAKRWTLKSDDVSGFDDPAVHAYHRLVVQRMAQADAVRLFLLKCDGRAVAACYCFQFGRRMYFFQPGFDPEFRKYHVGKVLVGKAIEYCFQNGYEEFDFLRGTEAYKYDWTDQQRQTFACNVALTSRARLVHAYNDARRRFETRMLALRKQLVTRIKASPMGAKLLARLKGQEAARGEAEPQD